MMRGLDWVALPIVIELLGIVDVERVIEQLLVMREFSSRGADG